MSKANSKINVPFARPWGAHMSISGGVENSIARGHKVGARAIQIFTKNNNRWEGPPIKPGSASALKQQSALLQVDVVAAHNCYLINLASPDKAILEKSRKAFLDEIERADLVGAPNLVFHPGAHKGEGEDDGIKRVVDSLNWIIHKTPGAGVNLTLETTAGQGTSLGHSFGQLSAIIDGVERNERLGVCVDTCHIFAAGYGLSTRKEYNATIRALDAEIGLGRVRMFHLNDSKKPLGARVDRHEHIGKGHIGLDGFGFLVNDARFANIPMVLETPKGEDGREDMENLAVLKNLITGKKQLSCP